MKMKLLSAAITAASLVGFSQSASAYGPATTPDLSIYLSGASAQDKAVDSLVKDICASNLHTFKDDGGFHAVADKGKWGKAYQAWFCDVTKAKVPTLSVNSLKVAIYKRAAGGSAMGVSPLLDDTANGKIAQLAINNGNCDILDAATNTYGCRISNAGDLQSVRSDAGVSDVNPEVFKGGLSTPDGFTPVDPAEVAAKFTVRPAAALAFGVPVGLELYKALQVAQGLTAAPNNCALGSNTDACMPNLTSAQIASILSGQVKSWSEFSVGGTDLVTVATNAGLTAPTDTLVHICKRTAGSGTGAQQYVKFLNNPCSGDSALPFATNDPFAGPVVHEMLESGDLEFCQDDLDKGAATIKDAVSGEFVNTVGNTAWSIGNQSLEKNSDKLKNYRFVKVDGVAPTLKNVANGSYKDWVELTWQYRKATVPAGAARNNRGIASDNGIPQGDVFAIVDTVIKNAGSPTKLNSLANKTHDFGRSGYLAVAANGYTFTDALVETAPVNPYSHVGTGKLDNCSAPVRPAADPATVIPVK